MRRWYILAVILLVVAIAAAYLLLTPGALDVFRSTKRITDTDTINKTALGYVGETYFDDYRAMRVPGWVDNLSKSEIRAARLKIQLLDEGGSKKEKISYELRDIPPMTRKTFDINAGTIGGTRTAEIEFEWIEVYE